MKRMTFIRYLWILLLLSLILGGIAGFAVYQTYRDDVHLFSRALSHYELGHYRNAVLLFGKYLKTPPYQPDLHERARYYIASSLMHMGGVLRYQLGNFDPEKHRATHDLAKEKLRECIQTNSMKNFYLQAIIDYAEVCRWYGVYDAFIVTRLRAITTHIKDEPLKRQAYALLGYQYFFANNPTKALESFAKTPVDLAQMGKAHVYQSQKQYPKAFDTYEAFLQNPSHAGSPYRSKAAERYVNTLRQEAKKHFLKKEDFKSKTYYKRLLRRFPTHPHSEEAKLHLGHMAFREAKYPLAKTYYQQVLTDLFTQYDDTALYYLGVCEEKTGHLLRSYQRFSQLLNRYPRSPYRERSLRWKKTLETKIRFFR